MGVDIYVLNFLAATQSIHRRSFGRTLTLGRQGFHITTDEMRRQAEQILRSHDPLASLDAIQPPGEPWANGLFRYLGSSSITSMDASAYEGADIVHDLNLPVPASLHGAFDTIYDGGTVEHVFDVPSAFRNVAAMLAVGGLFLSADAANNQLGHGLYQFSPELMWRVFGSENGFHVEAMYLTGLGGPPTLEAVRDPRVEGRRLEMGMTAAPTYLVVAARKTRSNSAIVAQQSDYARVWDASSAAPANEPLQRSTPETPSREETSLETQNTPAGVQSGSRTFDLALGAAATPVKGFGWSVPERAGLWNDGAQATLEVAELAPRTGYVCRLYAHPHIAPPSILQQRVIILNGEEALFNGAMTAPGSISFSFSTNEIGSATLLFRFPDATSPRSLGASTDSRRLALLVTRLMFDPAVEREIAAVAERPPPQPSRTNGEIVFLQTADAIVYKTMLDLTSRVNILYCQQHNIRYESYLGIKKGIVPWQATYNRIFMLHELLQRGFRGWAAFVDADAFVVDLAFDLRAYLASNSEYCLIGATGGSDAPWNLNAGVLFINFGDADGRAFVEDWLARFNAVVPEEFLASPEAAWEDHLNDQFLMYQCIQQNSWLMRKTKKEERGLFNYRDGAFIKQAIRAGFRDLSARVEWIRSETAALVEPVQPALAFADLTELANRYGSDKGTEIGNKHGYTRFYQFLFEEIRADDFSFLELGLLRGGPEVGGSNDRVANDAPSVRMWLDYFTRAVCHGFDISDFSSVTVERFRFHRGDLGSAVDLGRLRSDLPKLRFVIDDASHASYHQQTAFANLFPLVEPGGYYIIEDLDWQPEAYERELPRCELTRDLLLDFTRRRTLNIGFLPEPHRRILASQIGHVHLHRRSGDGLVKLVALQKLA